MAVAKRQSAFSQSVIEAEVQQQAKSEPAKPQLVESTEQSQPPISVAKDENVLPVATVVPVEPKSKGGRPRNLSQKTKATFYIKDDYHQSIETIQLLFAQSAGILVKNDGEVVDEAIGFMRFCLENEQSRIDFLKLYRYWLATRPT